MFVFPVAAKLAEIAGHGNKLQADALNDRAGVLGSSRKDVRFIQRDVKTVNHHGGLRVSLQTAAISPGMPPDGKAGVQPS